eukprot:364201-Chlamydomonas_euryale.AAC.25
MQYLPDLLPPNHNHCEGHLLTRLGSTALPGYRSHTLAQCYCLRPRQALDRVVGLTCQASFNSKGASFSIASRQACLSKARSAAAAPIFGPGINSNFAWLVNSRKTVIPPPEPYSWHPNVAELHIQEEPPTFL